ncbi:MAG: asparagine synthase (glutamine-hydrolyzing) [Patescibacteria group bacterium]|nr:asparagine synthase (glutamine-hydrolyzing) [Patescibacteria group bacterium]
MCGIGGLCGFRDDRIIKKMSQLMRHRGPDGEGIFSNDKVSLLNRRLAIIDRAGGDQPIWNEDKTVVVVFNGEIYNYRELRVELESRGHYFSTHSDTEVIVHSYEEWGDTCFDRFNGMFGIALYDIKRERLLLARDHFGIKPVYYAYDRENNNRILFASEIRPILESGLVDKKPNERILYRYLVYRIHDENEETFFAGVRRLLPGQMMLIENGKVNIRYYTQFQRKLKEITPKKTLSPHDVTEFREKVITAIHRRLVSEVPVGSALSGGLDSSTVVSVINMLLRKRNKDLQAIGKTQKTYSAVFPGSSNNEEQYIDSLVTSLEHVDSIKVKPTPEEFFSDLEDFVRSQEEPTISTGPYAQYQVMRRASKDVTVLLDGQGIDEMMAGYLPYYLVYMRDLLNSRSYQKLMMELWASRDIITGLLLRKLSAVIGLRKDISVKNLLHSRFADQYKNESFCACATNLRQRLIEDVFGNSLQALLRYEDKNSMRFSVEGRVPFLDRELTEYIFSLPDEAIIHKGWNKAILRDAMQGLIPDTIVRRRNKIGFTTPEREWFLRMKNRIYGIFLSESFASRPYFNQAAVLKAFEAFIEGKNDDTMLFWRLLNVELWMRIYFDEKPLQKEAKPRKLFEPNEGKQLEIEVEGKRYARYPVRTELFAKGDDYAAKLAAEVDSFRKKLLTAPAGKKLRNRDWVAIISEKVVAISQGRSYFIWDIHPSWWAKTLSSFVKKTPYGIGLGSPWTMQLAINEVGLSRILFASFAAAVTKPLGIKGLFYHIVGRTVASIDGPTEYSLYPSNVSAKLGPREPDKAAEAISTAIRKKLTSDERKHFMGAVVIDANDLGRDILGNASVLTDSEVAAIMRDNPMGQGSEQTPLVLAYLI